MPIQVRLKPLSSGKFFSAKNIGAAVKRGLKNAAKVADNDFKRSIKTWDEKPSLKTEEQNDGYTVGTDNKIYDFVSGGTRPHQITGNLAFQSYQAKTSVGSLDARSGGAFGPFAYANTVTHPGIKPREFPNEVVKNVSKQIVKLVQDEIARELG